MAAYTCTHQLVAALVVGHDGAAPSILLAWISTPSYVANNSQDSPLAWTGETGMARGWIRVWKGLYACAHYAVRATVEDFF
jgi:hypothetical protein